MAVLHISTQGTKERAQPQKNIKHKVITFTNETTRKYLMTKFVKILPCFNIINRINKVCTKQL